MQAIYGVTSGENIVQAFTEENTTEANFHQSINNAAILTFTTTEPLKDGVRFFLTKDPINDYKNEEFMYFEITDQDFDGYEYTFRAEEYAYHDLDTMGYVKKIYNQGNWTTKSLLESITYNDVEPKGIARTKWEVIDKGITLPTTWAGVGNTYTLWYNTPLRGVEKFIEYFGGEIRFYVTIVNNKISKHYMEIYLQRGRQTGKRYESNSNLISLTNKAEYSNRYEYIIPLAEGGGSDGDEQKNNTPNGFNNYITLEGLEVGKPTDKWHKPKSQLYVSLANDKNAYPLKSQPKGLQNNPRIKPVTFDGVKSKEALFDKAIEWLENNQGVAWSYSASVLDIGESQVGDTIAIIDERSGISSYVRVHDIDYDMIDPENTGVHFGSNWGYENDEAITDMVNTATSAQNNLSGLIDTAVRQSNGKNTNYYGTNKPADPIDGDLWYWEKGDESGIKIYQDGKWVDLVDTNTLNRINEQVDNALSEAKTYSDSLNAKQASEAAVFQSEANAALSSAAAERTVFSSNAASMATSAATHADSMANSAAAYGKTQAASALSSANSELAKAKKELGSEVSKAQSDIRATNRELAGKVSQTDFDKANDDLTKKYGQVKATADAVTTDVSKYKKSNDGKVSANAASIQTLNNQITSKVSQTDFDKTTGDLSGKYTETKQTVDKISNTVTELQAKANAQGQVNQLMNTEFNPDFQGWYDRNAYGKSINASLGASIDGSNVFVKVDNSPNRLQSEPIPVTPGMKVSYSVNKLANIWSYLNASDKDGNIVNVSNTTSNEISGTSQRNMGFTKLENIIIPDGVFYISLGFLISSNVSNGSLFSKPMLVFADHVGDYVPGNYNNNSRVSALEVSLDGITQTVNDPKNGLSATNKLASDSNTLAISAQNAATKAVTTANGVQTTVDDVQKDVKDLHSTITQTAGQVTTEIEDRKKGDKSVLSQTEGMISSQIKDYNLGVMMSMNTMANGIYASISTPNQLLNTNFTPDLENWNVTQKGGTTNDTFYRSILDDQGHTAVGVNIPDTAGSNSNRHYAYFEQDIPMPGWKKNVKLSLSWRIQVRHMLNYAWLWVQFLDGNKAHMLKSDGKQESVGYNYGATGNNADGKWHDGKFENISVPDGCVYIRISFQAREGTQLYLTSPMATFTDKAQSYMPGNYSGMNTQTVLTLAKDNFALGIQDNTKNIITGINGDTSGFVITGKKIMINGDTWFDGNNFMNAAVIKDGSIGTAKIGDLAVTSAKIKDLNVDKLTGNVSNFIQSNWTGKYESATIDSTGIAINVPAKESVTKYSGDGITIARYNGSTAYMAATQWEGSTDEGLQIGIGDDSEFFTLGYQDRKAGVYYSKLSWGSPKAVTVDHGFTFNDSINIAKNKSSDGSLEVHGDTTLWGKTYLIGDTTLQGGGELQGTFLVYNDTKFKNKNAGQALTMGSNNFNNFSYPTLGNNDGKNFAGFAYGSSQTYLVSDGTYYNLTNVIKALAGVGTLQIPTRINNDGTAAQWKTINIRG